MKTCGKGHPYAPENTSIENGYAKCRRCRSIRERARRERKATSTGREYRSQVLTVGADGERYDVERFWGHVDKSGECWLWNGNLTSSGYGTYAGRAGAHRIAYRITVGQIPPGYEVDHLCNVPRCVRPEHLEAVTREENWRRRVERQTHCKNGHEFTPENTYTGWGQRACKTCARRRAAAQRAAARELSQAAS